MFVLERSYRIATLLISRFLFDWQKYNDDEAELNEN
jgi:hypothetical protein